jgi:hypothetical protein
VVQTLGAGQFHFSIPGNPSARIINRGTINIGRAGLLAFVAPGVENSGIINARLGRVGLASSNQFTLDFYGDNLITLGVEGKVLEKVYGEDGKPISSMVDNKGTINADGGQVYLQTNSARDIVDHAINVSGIIEAKTAVKKRGNIILNGGSEGKVKVSGVLDASGLDSGQTGGTVHVLGDAVILEKARIFASGFNGGGTVLVGGDYQGKGSVLNARNTYFDTQSVIYGDAIYEGNGGKIILWADERTDALGKIYARGGSVGGDGGFVETSGKERLVVTQAADVSAPFGKPGEWLLDPFDIEIVDSLDNAALKGGNKIDVAIINAALNNGTSVKIQSNNNGEGEGNILLSSAIVKTSGGDSTLTLDAAGGITINKSITSSAGALTLDLIAATGVVLNESLVLNGGSVTLNSNETFNRPNNINPGSQNIVQTNHVSGVSQGAVAHVSGSPGGSVHLSGNQNKKNASGNHGNEIVLGQFFNKVEEVRKSYVNEEGKTITYQTLDSTAHLETSGGNVIFKDRVKINANVSKKSRAYFGGNFFISSDYFTINSGGGNVIFQDNVESVTGGLEVDSGRGNIDFKGMVESGSGFFSFTTRGGNVTFEDKVNAGSNYFSVNARKGNVVFKKALNSSLFTTEELENPTINFYVDGDNVTFNEIGNLSPFKSFSVNSSSTVRFLGKSNFRGRFNVRADNGIDIFDNMKIIALGNSVGADAISFDADSDRNGIGDFRIAKRESFSKRGHLSITAAGFALSHKIKNEHGSIDIYDTKVKKNFYNRDYSFYAHISGRGSVSAPLPSDAQKTLEKSSQIKSVDQSSSKTSNTANISGSKTVDFKVVSLVQAASTNSGKQLKIKRTSLSNLNNGNRKIQPQETPEQKAIRAASASNNRKIDAKIKEIRNQLVASRATARPVVPENRIAPRVLQQNVSSIWTRLVGSNDANRQRIPISNSISEQTLPQRASKVRNSLVGKNEAPNSNSQEDESDN